jgi:hypothetical protein
MVSGSIMDEFEMGTTETVCGDRVEVHYHCTHCRDSLPNSLENMKVYGNRSLIYWGEGVHPIAHDYTSRYGILDANEYKFKVKNSDLFAAKGPIKFWVSVHARPIFSEKFNSYHDQSQWRIRAFNNEMKAFFTAITSVVNKFYFLDMYNMTDSVIRMSMKKAPLDTSLNHLTHDGMHYTKSVNMIKVQILLNELWQMRQSLE